jgi:hypothetical protein
VSALDHADTGWCIPSPLRPSRFVSLWPQHEVHNVEVDLPALKASGRATHARDRSLLLYSDLQSLPGMDKGEVLGVARSGHHLGKFLKGVGRQGHLRASSGIRELVVTRYLESKGFGHAIVGCEGLLLAPLDRSLRDLAARSASGRDVAPIDRALQAITVRDGRFARASNFVWLLDHAWRGVTHVFFANLKRFLGTDGDDPTALARALGDSVERLLDAHEAGLRAGVYWGSVGEYSTVDGRFLDLERATLFGRPFVGLLAEADPPAAIADDGRAMVGCEALPHLIALRAAVDHLRQRLARLVEKGIIAHPIERAFVAEFLSALDRELGATHALRDRAVACARVADMIGRVLGLSPAARGQARELVEAHHDFLVHGRAPEHDWSLQRLPVVLARTASAQRLKAFSPAFAAVSGDLQKGRELNWRLDETFAQTTVDGALEAVRGLLDHMTPAVATAASW